MAVWIICTLWLNAKGAYRPRFNRAKALLTRFSRAILSVRPWVVIMPPTSKNEFTSFRLNGSMQNWLQISFRTWGVLPKQTVLERLICMPARVSNLWERSHAICKRATAAGAVAATLRRLLSSRKPPDEIVACGDMQSSMYRVHIANNAKEACKEKEQPWMKPLFLPHTCEEMAPLALYKHWNWL